MPAPQSHPVDPTPILPGKGNVPVFTAFDFVHVTPPPIRIPKFDLPAEDGVPMETLWHRWAMNLLIDVIHCLFAGRTDFFAGGNMFIYYGAKQAKTWSYRGPDFFYVSGVDATKKRRYWLTFEEEGRFPDVIVELTSPSTRKHDLTTKKDIYERTFRTPDYFCYDPNKRLLQGWALERGRYVSLVPNEKGWLWCEQLGLWLGTWEGEFQGQNDVWPRFYDQAGKLLPTGQEAAAARAERMKTRARAARKQAEAERKRAEAERKRAEAERKRAEAAEEELTRLKASLKQKGNGRPKA